MPPLHELFTTGASVAPHAGDAEADRGKTAGEGQESGEAGGGFPCVLLLGMQPALAAAITAAAGDDCHVVALPLAALGEASRLEPVLLLVEADTPAGAAFVEQPERHGWADVPLLVLSGNASPAARLAALEAGALEYLTLPIDVREVRARIRAHLALASRNEEQAARLRRRVATLELRLSERMLQLRTSREQLRLALDAAAMCWWQFSASTQEAEFSPNARHILGFVPPRQLLRFPEFVVAEDRLAFANALAHAVTSWDRIDLEFRVVHPATQRIAWHQAQAVIVPGERGESPRLVGVWRDITERKQGEDRSRHYLEDLESRVQERTAELDEMNGALRNEVIERRRSDDARLEILRQIVTAQEDERRRISRELHDEIGQHLSALTLGLKSLSRGGVESPMLEQLQALTDRIGREVHDLAFNLRPASLDDLGLVRTLQNYVEEWSERVGIAMDFHCAGFEGVRLAPHLETTLYRIVQEALNNVFRHSRARRVSLILERRADQVIAIVEDDGGGFDVEAVTGNVGGRRLGLVGMRERAALIGGELKIDSSPGSGTTVIVRAPVAF